MAVVTVVVFAHAVPIGYAPLFVLGPSVAEGSYDSPALFGIVATLIGAGALAGALAGLTWRPRHPMRAAFLVTAGWPVPAGRLRGWCAGPDRPRRSGGHGIRLRAVQRVVEHDDG